jgi:hypothetical protein
MKSPSLHRVGTTIFIFITCLWSSPEIKAQAHWVVEENTSGFTMTGSGSFTFANIYDEPYEDDFSSAAFIGRSEVGIDDSDYSFWVGSAGENDGRILSIIGGRRMTDGLISSDSFEGVITDALMSSSFALSVLPTPSYYTPSGGIPAAYHSADIFYHAESVVSRTTIDYEVPAGTYTPRDELDDPYEVAADTFEQVELVTVSVGPVSMSFNESVQDVFGTSLDNGPVTIWQDAVSEDTITLSLSTIVPEPSSSGLLMISLMACMLRRHR